MTTIHWWQRRNRYNRHGIQESSKEINRSASGWRVETRKAYGKGQISIAVNSSQNTSVTEKSLFNNGFHVKHAIADGQCRWTLYSQG
jgi:hypothetical protein